jgi:hypothetical protein
MKAVELLLFGACLFFSTPVPAQQAVPPGTVLPIRLNSSLSLKTRPGKVISGRIMQDVTLTDGASLRAGTRVLGHVIRVSSETEGVSTAELSFAFDKVMVSNRAVPITTNLRAMASFMEVEGAQVPENGPDRGTPESAYTTVLVGGDVDYRGGGPVMEGSNIVGRPILGGVVSEVSLNPGSGCRGSIDGNNSPQALWVFSSDACGLYGFPGVEIAHSGRRNPVGEIVLKSNSRKLNVPSGTGMLLRVITGTETSS